MIVLSGSRYARRYLLLIVGTRPEAIKLWPVARTLANNATPFMLLLTGQHAAADINEQMARLGGLSDDVICECATCSIEEIGAKICSDEVAAALVCGDTRSAYLGATAAYQSSVPVVHVEAGLRTYAHEPWPEEVYRTEISKIVELHCAPTEGAAENLRREARPGRVIVTGNTSIDALVCLQSELHKQTRRLRRDGRRNILVTSHRRENRGKAAEEIVNALELVSQRHKCDIDIVWHHSNALVSRLGMSSHIHVVPAMMYAPFITRMMQADLIISDSGGIQEEASFLGVPLLITRDVTERPEVIEAGAAMLVGAKSSSIVSAVDWLWGDPEAAKRMATPRRLFGDGHAAQRIVSAILERWSV